jgi:ATP-binding cassette, subfamily C (CFTR/MRP), member 1
LVENAPQLFSSLTVFAIVSIQKKLNNETPLSYSQAFTSLAIVNLLTHPAALLLGSFPMAAAAFGCLQRIEKFLSTETLDDQRVTEDASNESPGSPKKIVLEISELSVGTIQNLDGRLINCKAERGSVTMCLGPIGSGKSTLLRMILGEQIPRTGHITVANPVIGFCSQTPWLPNSSIRDAIVGPATEFDEKWYRIIIDLCELGRDFSQMPLGDSTVIGSRGLILSGGQKHRIVSGIQSRLRVIKLTGMLVSC